MNSIERRAAISLALIYSTRMLGLFMILPVFVLYAEKLADITPFLIGVAIGIYGLTQAIFQIPFGIWSDRIGRKPVIIFGLLLFALGSVVAALATSIEWIIIGRALQGTGAIAAAVMALAADLTREQHRTKVMAIIGGSIGFSFMLALILGPILQAWFGVPGIFWLTAVLALLGILIVSFLVPNVQLPKMQSELSVGRRGLGLAINNAQLLRLDFGVFILHMVLTAVFVVVPSMLQKQFALDMADHWQVYLAVMLASIVLLIPSIIFSEKKQKTKEVLLAAIFLCILSQLSLFQSDLSFWSFILAMVVFFWGFNLLEATLPSLVSKTCNAGNKGAAMGVFSSSQFFGAFVGGSASGLILQRYDASGVFLFAAIMLTLWFLVAFSMRKPDHRPSYNFQVGVMASQQAAVVAQQLQDFEGVLDAAVIGEQGVAYLRIDKQRFIEQKCIEKFANLN